MKNIQWIILYRCTGKSFPMSSELSFPKTLQNIIYTECPVSRRGGTRRPA